MPWHGVDEAHPTAEGKFVSVTVGCRGLSCAECCDQLRALFAQLPSLPRPRRCAAISIISRTSPLICHHGAARTKPSLQTAPAAARVALI